MPFIYFSWLGLPIQCWIKVGILALFLILEKRFSALHSYDVSCGFIMHSLHYLEIHSLYTHFVESFYHKCWILPNGFPASVEMIIWVLSFVWLIWCITLINLGMFNAVCILGIYPCWLWFMTFLMCSWIQFASILLKIFASMFIKEISVVTLSRFNIRVMLAL